MLLNVLPMLHHSTSLHPIPLACYLFLKYSNELSSLFVRALNLLFPLPEILFPWIFTHLVPYHSGLYFDVTTSVRLSPVDLLS